MLLLLMFPKKDFLAKTKLYSKLHKKNQIQTLKKNIKCVALTSDIYLKQHEWGKSADVETG